MRKYDEGYALPFAVVVMLVLGIVVASILPFSLQNFKNQQASIERMQDKYEAQGEVEKAIALIETQVGDFLHQTYSSVADAQAHLKSEIGMNVEWLDDESRSCTIELSIAHESVQIDCTIVLKDIITNGTGGGCTFQKPTITYESYTVTYLDTPASAETTEDTP